MLVWGCGAFDWLELKESAVTCANQRGRDAASQPYVRGKLSWQMCIWEPPTFLQRRRRWGKKKTLLIHPDDLFAIQAGAEEAQHVLKSLRQKKWCTSIRVSSFTKTISMTIPTWKRSEQSWGKRTDVEGPWRRGRRRRRRQRPWRVSPTPQHGCLKGAIRAVQAARGKHVTRGKAKTECEGMWTSATGSQNLVQLPLMV